MPSSSPMSFSMWPLLRPSSRISQACSRPMASCASSCTRERVASGCAHFSGISRHADSTRTRKLLEGRSRDTCACCPRRVPCDRRSSSTPSPHRMPAWWMPFSMSTTTRCHLHNLHPACIERGSCSSVRGRHPRPRAPSWARSMRRLQRPSRTHGHVSNSSTSRWSCARTQSFGSREANQHPRLTPPRQRVMSREPCRSSTMRFTSPDRSGRSQTCPRRARSRRSSCRIR